VVTLVVVASCSISHADNNKDGIGFVKNMAHKMSVLLGKLDLDDIDEAILLNGDENDTGVCKMIDDNVFFVTVAKYVSGSAYRKAKSDDDRKAYLLAAKSALAGNLASMFDNAGDLETATYSVLREFRRTFGKEKRTFIDIRVKMDDLESAVVIRLIRSLNSKSLKLFDMLFDGVSRLKVTRSQYVSVAKGDLKYLTDLLKKLNSRNYGQCDI